MRKAVSTPKGLVRIVGPELAENPADGGRWALYCLHLETLPGLPSEWTVQGIVQDTNKRRLAEWAKAKLAGGYTEWCCECQRLSGE